LKRRNIGVLITDHNVQETLSITDEATLLFEGSILRQGATEDMAEDPEVRRLYLGKNFEFKRKTFESPSPVTPSIDVGT
jgi:lipopolysaccharide export system ATP-binding protein